MNNEIGRKLTSLTLMTIMLAGGMVIGAPSLVPEAAAAGQLYVSAENAMFENHFGGAQIVEVIVRDPNQSETDEIQAEPTVRVDNNILRMAQGADGYWYAYIGDDTDVTAADTADNNLDFGCDGNVGGKTQAGAANVLLNKQENSLKLYSKSNFTSSGHSKQSYITTFLCADKAATDKMLGVITNPPALSNWNGSNTAFYVGQEKPEGTYNSDGTSTWGQIGLNQTDWPFIQTFDFTQGDFDIILEQPGADEVVTLDHDNADVDDYASLTLDRNSATQGAEVMMFIVDNQLNIDPTNEDVVIFNVTTGSESVSFTNGTVPVAGTDMFNNYAGWSNSFGDNGKLIIDYDASGVGTDVFTNDITEDDITADKYLVFYEDADNTGTFSNVDNKDDANLIVNTAAKRGTTATIDYNDSAQSFVVANDFGVLDMVESTIGDEWNSGESLTVRLTDQDLNKNTWNDEDLTIADSVLIPSLQIGSPITLGNGTVVEAGEYGATSGHGEVSIASFSKLATVDTLSGCETCVAGLGDTHDGIDIITDYTIATVRTADALAAFTVLNYDVSTLTLAGTTNTLVELVDVSGDVLYANEVLSANRGVVELGDITAVGGTLVETENLRINFTGGTEAIAVGDQFYADLFTFGDRVNNAIYRIELEETGDDTGIFEGSVEYIMLNQLNVDVASTFTGIDATSDEIDIIVHEDLTDEDSPRINYLDLGADGVKTQIADQVAAPSHSGVVTLDMDNYKIADTVIVTLDDQDMNTDSELIDVYVTKYDDKVGNAGTDHVLDITFDDKLWQEGTTTNATGSPDNGLQAAGFTLVETGLDSGIFTGSFQVPSTFWDGTVNDARTVTGTDIEVNYNDHRDASGETIEVGDGAAINANTGSVSFDRNVYPVPFGINTTTSNFAEHATAADTDLLPQGDTIVHVRVTDADYNVSAMGEDTISDTTVAVKLQRGSNSVTIATVGTTALPITEVSPDSGVFEYDVTVNYEAGPQTGCPAVFTEGCVLQGDIVTVTYTDKNDASGQSQTVTDSATFDLRNGVLQSDKSVYLIGSDMILTLIEPDFDLDNDGAESYTLNLIEWDSDAATTAMGDGGVTGAAAAFDPEPSSFRETGDSTGIFQVVVEIPDTLDGELLDRGEMVELEYTDWGPAGADYVGQEDEDIGLTVYTSNFGATIELDQKVYTWTDKVYITIVAPDHNFDSGLVDEIGNTATDPIKVSTRGNELTQYKLVESGADTGIFIGEVTLAGFKHDADGDGVDDITDSATTLTTGNGPTEGKLATTDNDGLTVSFEFSEDETVVGSALVRWNIGEVQWLEASYPASGTGVVRVIDADMNLDPEAIDNFAVDAWSDSDAGGIDLTVTETNEATGIFEGTVFFTVSNDSSGHRLRVSEGDTVTAEYEDNTLPDPYTTADELDITATSLIGTIVPPLERAPAANLRTVDAFGNSLTAVSVDQQVQISADLANGQDREQSFAYLVQVQDGNGVTVSLAWITGSLSSGQSFSPALSWIPTESGSYTATAFVWESVDNPTALSPPVSTTISVQ